MFRVKTFRINHYSFEFLGDQRVLIGDIKVLTLYKGRHTQARRVSPIPHIKCIGGTAKCLYEPDVIHCYNRGSDGIDIQVRIFPLFLLEIIIKEN